MKKSIIVIAAVLTLGLFSNQVKAQTVGAGIRGGVNFSHLNNASFGTDKYTGLMLGLYFTSPVYNNIIIFQPELLYTQKGYNIGTNEFKVSYVEIPVTLRINGVNPSGVLPFVYFGPYIAFKINADFPTGIIGFSEDQVNTMDFGLTFGGGLDFGHIEVGVRYEAGLTEIVDQSGAKFRVLSIVAGLGF